MLEVRGLTKRFGARTVTDGIDLTLAPGARHALIGPNGAGKTTLINLLTGVLKPDAGSIRLNGENVVSLAPHVRVMRGLSRTHQINTLCPALTPLQAISVAIAQRENSALRLWRFKALGQRIATEAAALLESVGLGDHLTCPTRELAYGQQRLLEVALALAAKPKVLLLDEPAAGVSPAASQRLFDLLERLPSELAVLLIEHDMQLVFRLATRISVLVSGAILLEGTPAQIAAAPQVREVYLGTRHVAAN